MLLRITVKTPKNQAAKCVTTQKTQLVGHDTPIIRSRVLAHNKYYLVISTEDVEGITARCAKAETMIKTFYNHLIKWITRANKLVKKFDKGIGWVRNYLRSQALHTYRNPQAVTQINQISDKELRELIQIKDLKEMQELLKRKLISVTEEKTCSDDQRKT
jgi:hypothetical protein